MADVEVFPFAAFSILRKWLFYQQKSMTLVNWSGATGRMNWKYFNFDCVLDSVWKESRLPSYIPSKISYIQNWE